MKTIGMLGAAALLLLGVAPADAGSKYQSTLVPNVAATTPGFSARGSSVKLDGVRHVLSGKLKGVVDGLGDRVTTDPNTTGDEYSVEVDLEVLPSATLGTVAVSFDVMNGNGKFSVDSTTSAALAAIYAAAATGDGIAVRAVRVKDALGAVIGAGGVVDE